MMDKIKMRNKDDWYKSAEIFAILSGGFAVLAGVFLAFSGSLLLLSQQSMVNLASNKEFIDNTILTNYVKMITDNSFSMIKGSGELVIIFSTGFLIFVVLSVFFWLEGFFYVDKSHLKPLSKT